MRSVKHGESHNIGLFIHNIIQSQEGKVLGEEEKKKKKEGERSVEDVCKKRQKIQVSDNIDSESNLRSEEKHRVKRSVIKKRRGYGE